MKVFGEFGEAKFKSPFWARGWTSGRLPDNLGTRREKPQEKLNLFLLKPILLGSEPGLAKPKLIVLRHLTLF